MCGDEPRTNSWTLVKISSVCCYESVFRILFFSKTYDQNLHLHAVTCLTLFGAVAPAGYPAAVSLGEGLRGGRKAHRLDKRGQAAGPRLSELQQSNVVVKGTSVVVLVHYNAADLSYMLCVALSQHAKVRHPLAGVRESGKVIV